MAVKKYDTGPWTCFCYCLTKITFHNNLPNVTLSISAIDFEP
jgi:hypothetical protein